MRKKSGSRHRWQKRRRHQRTNDTATRSASDVPSPALLYVLASVLLVVPCYWQSRLQLGDLSSHIYNAWLAQLIESGASPGAGHRSADHHVF